MVTETVILSANKHKTTGVLLVGIRHWDVSMHTQFEALEQHMVLGNDFEQGFLTNIGRFVDRQEGWIIARDCGQIIKRVGGDTCKGGTLFSENLW